MLQLMKQVFAAFLALGMIPATGSAATAIYTDLASFELATGAGLNFEDFSDTTFENVSITTNQAGSAFLTNGQLRARPTPAGTTLTYTFDSPTTAFGGDFDLSPGGNGNGLRFVLDGNEIVSEEIGAPYIGFWGFVSDTSFTTLTVEAGSGPGIAETHLFDNLSFGVAMPAAIPLPAGFILLLSALTGIFGWQSMARRRRVTAA